MKLILAAAVVLAALPASAHTGSDRRLAATAARDAAQATRIGNGLAAGQINATEAARLGAQQARIDAGQARLTADGRYSRRDHARISYRQGLASRNIARARR